LFDTSSSVLRVFKTSVQMLLQHWDLLNKLHVKSNKAERLLKLFHVT